MIKRSGYVFFAVLLVFFFSGCATSKVQNSLQIQGEYKQSGGQPQEVLNTIEDWHNQCLAAGGKDCRISITALADGWQVDISVAGIKKPSTPVPPSGFKMNSRNWLQYTVDADYFHAKGGQSNLLDIMNAFYQWMKEEANGKK